MIAFLLFLCFLLNLRISYSASNKTKIESIKKYKKYKKYKKNNDRSINLTKISFADAYKNSRIFIKLCK